MGQREEEKSRAEVCLNKHSYWFDFWMFILIDAVFFLFIYFVVP